MLEFLKNLFVGAGGEVTETSVELITEGANKALTLIVEREVDRTNALVASIATLNAELDQSRGTREKAEAKLKALNA